jgi:hypothetical protein
LTAFSTKIEDIPEILLLLADFLKKEPNESFLGTSIGKDLEVPLTLTPEAEKRFKEKTEKYPFIYNSGNVKKWFTSFNMLYTIGEVLTQISMPIEALNMKKPELGYHIEALYHIWDSMENMSARGLVEKFKNHSTGDTKRVLISKLKASAETIKSEILPLLK